MGFFYSVTIRRVTLFTFCSGMYWSSDPFKNDVIRGKALWKQFFFGAFEIVIIYHLRK